MGLQEGPPQHLQHLNMELLTPKPRPRFRPPIGQNQDAPQGKQALDRLTAGNLSPTVSEEPVQEGDDTGRGSAVRDMRLLGPCTGSHSTGEFLPLAGMPQGWPNTPCGDHQGHYPAPGSWASEEDLQVAA